MEYKHGASSTLSFSILKLHTDESNPLEKVLPVTSGGAVELLRDPDWNDIMK